MAIFQCKMCGATLNVTEGSFVTNCEYCGTPQTLPRLQSDKKASLYERAGQLRRNYEYDKAAELYEKILEEDPTDAETFWSLVLCTYGIEYVVDPSTGKRKPTVNRIQYTPITNDTNYKYALQYASEEQKVIYQTEASMIASIQKGYLEISKKEKPFDIFICYKESDEKGVRTPDSVLAQELYYELTEQGFKVFFARITLEDKLGTAYEPYIFSALNTSKIMVVVGTKPEYFNAVWVKNEWSRFLSLIKGGENKVLIPAYRDMDPYNLPSEFSNLQAQNMAKLGFMQDLVRGINKIIGGYTPTQAPKQAVTGENPLVTRAEMFVKDGFYDEASVYCDQVISAEPENGKAYLYKLLCQAKVPSLELLEKSQKALDTMSAYKPALRFADAETAKHIAEANRKIKERTAANPSFIHDINNTFFDMPSPVFQDPILQYENEINELKRKRTLPTILMFVFIIFLWPVGLYFAFKVGKINKEIRNIKKQLKAYKKAQKKLK